MTEPELLFSISNIANGGASFSDAAARIANVLEREAGCVALFIDHSDSFDQPYESLYSVDLRGGGQTLGKLTLAFTSDNFERLSTFVGEQLGMLLARTRLAERRARLKREIAEISQDLATRKLMQRAEGILIARRGMTSAAAKLWIAQQSQKTGLSKFDVADRIIAYYQATGLLEQKIA